MSVSVPVLFVQYVRQCCISQGRSAQTGTQSDTLNTQREKVMPGQAGYLPSFQLSIPFLFLRDSPHSTVHHSSPVNKCILSIGVERDKNLFLTPLPWGHVCIATIPEPPRPLHLRKREKVQGAASRKGEYHVKTRRGQTIRTQMFSRWIRFGGCPGHTLSSQEVEHALCTQHCHGLVMYAVKMQCSWTRMRGGGRYRGSQTQGGSMSKCARYGKEWAVMQRKFYLENGTWAEHRESERCIGERWTQTDADRLDRMGTKTRAPPHCASFSLAPSHLFQPYKALNSPLLFFFVSSFSILCFLLPASLSLICTTAIGLGA